MGKVDTNGKNLGTKKEQERTRDRNEMERK